MISKLFLLYLNNMDIEQDILFLPTGEIKTISLYELGVLIGSDKSEHTRLDEKLGIAYFNDIEHWVIPDNKRELFKRLMYFTRH